MTTAATTTAAAANIAITTNITAPQGESVFRLRNFNIVGFLLCSISFEVMLPSACSFIVDGRRQHNLKTY
jgi:hypothetical protein